MTETPNPAMLKLAGAAIGGYVLGRFKKGRAAISFAMWMAGAKDPKRMLRDGLLSAAQTPEAQQLLTQLRGPALEAGRRVAAATFENQLGALTSALEHRTKALTAAAGDIDGGAVTDLDGRRKKRRKKAAAGEDERPSEDEDVVEDEEPADDDTADTSEADAEYEDDEYEDDDYEDEDEEEDDEDEPEGDHAVAEDDEDEDDEEDEEDEGDTAEGDVEEDEEEPEQETAQAAPERRPAKKAAPSPAKKAAQSGGTKTRPAAKKGSPPAKKAKPAPQSDDEQPEKARGGRRSAPAGRAPRRNRTEGARA